MAHLILDLAQSLVVLAIFVNQVLLRRRLDRRGL